MTVKKIHVRVTQQVREAGPKPAEEAWRRADSETLYFTDLAEYRAYLAEHYGKRKRVSMYRDGANGEGVKVGYIYSWREQNYDSRGTYWQYRQDWVEARELGGPIVP